MRLIVGLCIGQKKKKKKKEKKERRVLCQSDVLKNISQNLDPKIFFSKSTLSILSSHFITHPTS